MRGVGKMRWGTNSELSSTVTEKEKKVICGRMVCGAAQALAEVLYEGK